MAFFSSKTYKKNVPKKYKKLFPKNKYPSSFNQLSKRINMVKSMLNVEYKTRTHYNQINQALGNVSNITAPLVYCNSIAQGVQEDQRNGNSIKLATMAIRLNFTANGSNSIPQNVRVMLVKDLNRNSTAAGADGLVPTLGTILQPDDPATARVDNLYAFLSDTTSGRFKIIMNEMFTLDRGARAGRIIDKYFKFNEELKYPINTSTNPVNGYYMFWFTDATGANVPTVSGQVRCRYIDN